MFIFSTADVIVVIGNDTESELLTGHRQYNSNLRLVFANDVMQDLASSGRVFSLNREMSPHQMSHLRKTVKTFMNSKPKDNSNKPRFITIMKWLQTKVLCKHNSARPWPARFASFSAVWSLQHPLQNWFLGIECIGNCSITVNMQYIRKQFVYCRSVMLLYTHEFGQLVIAHTGCIPFVELVSWHRMHRKLFYHC